MKQVTVFVEDYLYEFYKKVGESAGGHSVEKVMEDVLFKLAGELSAGVLNRKSGTKN